MTLEQYFSEWLAEALSRELKTVITPDAVSLTMTDAADVDKWRRMTSFEIVVNFKGKATAAEVSEAVGSSLPLFKRQRYINGVYVDTQMARRIGSPTQWEYLTNVRVLHRKDVPWQR